MNAYRVPQTFTPQGVSAAPQGASAAARTLRWWIGIWLPTALVALGVVTYFFAGNIAFIACSGIGSILTTAVTLAIVFKSKEIRLTWMLGTGLLLGYSAGTFNTALGLIPMNDTLSRYFGQSQEDLSHALGVAMWVSAELFFLGLLLEKPIRLNLEKLRRSDVRFIYIGLAITATALATGQIGYMGMTTSDDGHVSALGEAASFAGQVLPGLTIFIQEKFRSRLQRAFFYLLLVVELVSLYPQGRREILYAGVVALLAFNIRGVVWGPQIWKKILLVASVGTFFYVGNVVFYAMRYTVFQAHTRQIALGELVSRAVDFIQNGRDVKFDQQLAKNVRERTMVLNYFTELLGASRDHEPLYGKDLLYCARIAVPSFLDRDKDKILDIGMEETFANPWFGLPFRDEANSILTTGITDFGLAGVFGYPIAVCLLMSALVRFLMKRLPEVGKIVIVLIVIDRFIRTESPGTDFTVLFRNVVAVTVVVLLLDSIPKKFLRIGRAPKPALRPARQLTPGSDRLPVPVLRTSGLP